MNIKDEHKWYGPNHINENDYPYVESAISKIRIAHLALDRLYSPTSADVSVLSNILRDALKSLNSFQESLIIVEDDSGHDSEHDSEDE